MTAEFAFDPRAPRGEGRTFREVADGTAFVWTDHQHDPARRIWHLCIASDMINSWPSSQVPWDCRLAVELETGANFWLPPETPCVVVAAKVVPAA
jgi:hypothetical protein